MTCISGEFSNEETGSIARILASRPRENDPGRAAEEYIRILTEENEKMTPEQIAQADTQTIMEQLRKLKEKKK